MWRLGIEDKISFIGLALIFLPLVAAPPAAAVNPGNGPPMEKVFKLKEKKISKSLLNCIRKKCPRYKIIESKWLLF